MNSENTLIAEPETVAPRGRRAPGRASSADVARLSGLSRTTVSYVLNDRRDVPIPEATRARVWAAVGELGYSTNPLAQALKTGRTGVVGLRLAGLNTPFVNMLQAALYQRAHAAGYDVLITNLDLDSRSASGLKRLARWPLDGVIAYADSGWVASMRAEYGDHCPAMVSLSWYSVEDRDHVWWNLEPGATEAVRHLVASGCRDIAYVAPPLGCRDEEVRYRCYQQVMKEMGLAPRVVPTEGEEREDALVTARALLKQGARPDAWFCYNDDFAFGTRAALHQAGFTVPDDALIVGCDGLREGAYSLPALSTVEVPMAEVAEAAWELLERRMAAPEVEPECREVDTRLLVRESSGGA